MRAVVAACCVAALLIGQSWAADEAPGVEVMIMGAGIVKIEGRAFSDVPALKAKIREIKNRKPQPELHILLAPGTGIDAIEPAVALLSKSGGPPKIGFLTEPARQ